MTKPIFNAQSVRDLQNQPQHERVINQAAMAGKKSAVLVYEHKRVALYVKELLRQLDFSVSRCKTLESGFQIDVTW